MRDEEVIPACLWRQRGKGGMDDEVIPACPWRQRGREDGLRKSFPRACWRESTWPGRQATGTAALRHSRVPMATPLAGTSSRVADRHSGMRASSPSRDGAVRAVIPACLRSVAGIQWPIGIIRQSSTWMPDTLRRHSGMTSSFIRPAASLIPHPSHGTRMIFPKNSPCSMRSCARRASCSANVSSITGRSLPAKINAITCAKSARVPIVDPMYVRCLANM